MGGRNPQSSILNPQREAAGWTASLLFWGCLLSAAGLYAVAALAPKLHAHRTLKQQYYDNQVQLVGLERQTQSLKRVVEALQTDPEFVEELARAEFRASPPGEEHLPLDSDLSFNGLGPVASKTIPTGESDTQQRSTVWYAPLLEHVVLRREVRVSLLASAGLLVLLAFTIFREPRTASNRSAGKQRAAVGSWLVNRYR